MTVDPNSIDLSAFMAEQLQRAEPDLLRSMLFTLRPGLMSAEADNNVLMKVPSSSRSRSGLAWASCSSSRAVGSIPVTVIVMLHSRVLWKAHPKDHPMADAYFNSDTLTGIRTPLCWTSLISVATHSAELQPVPDRNST